MVCRSGPGPRPARRQRCTTNRPRAHPLRARPESERRRAGHTEPERECCKNTAARALHSGGHGAGGRAVLQRRDGTPTTHADPPPPMVRLGSAAHKYIRSAGDVRPSPDGAWPDLGRADGRQEGPGRLTSRRGVTPPRQQPARSLDKGTAHWHRMQVSAVDNLDAHHDLRENPPPMASHTVPWQVPLFGPARWSSAFGAITKQQLLLCRSHLPPRRLRHAVYVWGSTDGRRSSGTTAIGVPRSDVTRRHGSGGHDAALPGTGFTWPTLFPGGAIAQEGLIRWTTAACRSTTARHHRRLLRRLVRR